jgi:hypothetical protein
MTAYSAARVVKRIATDLPTPSLTASVAPAAVEI